MVQNVFQNINLDFEKKSHYDWTWPFLVCSVSDRTHELLMAQSQLVRICSLGVIWVIVKGAHEYDGSKEPQ